MAKKRTRRSFTREFKAQAVKRLLEGGKGLSEVATELGLSTGQLSTWRSEQLAAGSAEVSMLLVSPPKRLDENSPNWLVLWGSEFGGACLGRPSTAAWDWIWLGDLPSCGGFRQQVGMAA